jgi:hypothetical protein
VKLQSAGLICFPQISQEQIPKAAAQNLHREKERGFLASNPTNAVRANAASGNHAMQVRMQMEILPPGVQHSQESDCRSQTPGIGSDGQQRFRCRTKQDAIDLARILQRQGADLVRQREYDMEVGNRQQLAFPRVQPFGASHGLAFWAMSVTARVI